MSELKACPFCGKTDTVGVTRETPLGFDRVQCRCGRKGKYGDTEAEAIAAWNYRPIEDALRKRIVKLKQQIEATDEYYLNEVGVI